MFNSLGEREHLFNPDLMRRVRDRQRQEAARRVRERERQKERERDERKRRLAEAMNREKFLDAMDPLRPLRRSGFPAWAIDIVCRVAEKHNISPLRLVASTHRSIVVDARHEAIYEIKRAKPALSSTQIGKWFGRDHTSVLYGMARHAANNDLPPMCGFDASGKMARSNNWHAARKQSNDVA